MKIPQWVWILGAAFAVYFIGKQQSGGNDPNQDFGVKGDNTGPDSWSD